MSLQTFYGTRSGSKQLSHKRKSIIYLLYNLDLSTGFRLGCCIQNQIYFIDSKYLHCSNNFCSCANILKLQSQISNRHLIGLYWIVFIFHQIIKGSARKKNHVFILPHRNSLYCYDTYRAHAGILNMIILFILSRYIQYKNFELRNSFIEQILLQNVGNHFPTVLESNFDVSKHTVSDIVQQCNVKETTFFLLFRLLNTVI